MTIFGEILRAHGEELTVVTEGAGQKVKAFVRPMKRRDGRQTAVTRLGEKMLSKYCYFGPPEVEIKADETVILFCGAKYAVVKAELYRACGRASHWEAILEIEGENGLGDA
jgi:hypothetical protein